MYSLEELKQGAQPEKNAMTNSRLSGLSLNREQKKGSLTVSGQNLRANLGLIGKKQDTLEKRVETMSKGIIAQAAKIRRESNIHLICFFDKSASCRGTEYATIAGYRELIEKERKQCLPTKITTVLFDRKSYVVNRRTDIEQLPGLEYCADGASTAIYDTLTTHLRELKNEAEEGEKTIVAIMTDGADNASYHCDEASTRAIVKECQAMGWEFIFLGANYLAVQTASVIGIKEQNTALFLESPEGYYTNFLAVERAISSMREVGTITPDWSNEIKKTYAALGSGTGNPQLENGNNHGPVKLLGGRK